MAVASCGGYTGLLSKADPADYPVIQLTQNMNQLVSLQLVNNDGSPNTSPTAPVQDPTQGIPIIIGPDPAVINTSSLTASIVMAQYPGDPNYVTVSGSYISNGLFNFNFTTDNTATAGILIGTLFLQDSSTNVVFAKNLYTSIEWNVLSTSPINANMQPLTISELRLAIRDSVPEANYLLEDYEFTDREIAHSIRRPVDMWNETPPSLCQFRPDNFPYRYNHVECCIGILLKLAAHRYRRNDLKYSTSGVSVADQAKWQEYDAAGNERIQAYKQWMRDKKIEMNINGAFGGLPGAWANSGWW